jgi:CHAT domain-containing protein
MAVFDITTKPTSLNLKPGAIGHGGLDVASQQGVLVLEDKEGNPIKASAERLGVVLHEEPTLRLAVLNSCEGGRAGASDIFSGVAQTLIQQDVPAVVAMQFEMSDAAAVTFARDFYRALAFGDPVDAAVSQARQAIYAENELEWGTPVLYMRAADGQLFSVDTSERPALVG